MSARENRRQRQKTDASFGDLMLPIIGLIAVGLLIVGIKFFFLSEPSREQHKPVIVHEKTTTTAAPSSTVASTADEPLKPHLTKLKMLFQWRDLQLQLLPGCSTCYPQIASGRRNAETCCNYEAQSGHGCSSS